MLHSPPHTEESYSHFLPSNIFNWHIFYCTLHIIFFLASWSGSDKQKRPGNQKSQLVSYFITGRERSSITSAGFKRSPVGFSSWNTSRNNCPSCSICVPVFSISPGLLFTLLFVSGHRTNTEQEGAPRAREVTFGYFYLTWEQVTSTRCFPLVKLLICLSDLWRRKLAACSLVLLADGWEKCHVLKQGKLGRETAGRGDQTPSACSFFWVTHFILSRGLQTF